METMSRGGRLQKTRNLISVIIAVCIAPTHAKSNLPPLNSYTVGVSEKDLIHYMPLDYYRNQNEPNSNLRNNNRKLQPTTVENGIENKLLFSRRLYSEDNAYVRRNKNILENLSIRSQTGLVDPKRSEYVKYADDHPMQQWADRHRRLVEKHNGDLRAAHAAAAVSSDNDKSQEANYQRKLESSTSSSSSNNNSSSSNFRPIRITFNTDALDAQDDGTNTAKINFIKTQLLPRAAAFWSQTLSVVPVQGYLQINPSDLVNGQYCGDTEFSLVPEEEMYPGILNTDLRLYVSGSNSTTYCGPSTLAVAVACNFDQYDRPVAGAVNICLGQVSVV